MKIIRRTRIRIKERLLVTKNDAAQENSEQIHICPVCNFRFADRTNSPEPENKLAAFVPADAEIEEEFVETPEITGRNIKS